MYCMCFCISCYKNNICKISIPYRMFYCLSSCDYCIKISIKKEIKRNIEKALYYLNQSAIRNNNMATNVLAMLFLNGQFVPHDIKKGMQYLSLSAMYNNSNAQYILGIFYYYGIYIEKNVYRSLHFLIQSSQNGDKSAYFCIGYI